MDTRESVNSIKEGIIMTNYREILRLKSLGMNKQETAASVGCSRNTVAEVLRRAEALKLSHPLPEGITDSQLATLLYPSSSDKPVYKMPDYAYVAKEMMKDGVTLNLLWIEYCEKCLAAGETPYQSTQFNKYYNDYLTKNNATMHLNHKRGEIMQVDWAGDTATVIDTDTGKTIPAYIFCSNAPLQRIQLCGSILFHESGMLGCRTRQYIPVFRKCSKDYPVW